MRGGMRGRVRVRVRVRIRVRMRVRMRIRVRMEVRIRMRVRATAIRMNEREYFDNTTKRWKKTEIRAVERSRTRPE
jgi:hypothetical protein